MARPTAPRFQLRRFLAVLTFAFTVPFLDAGGAQAGVRIEVDKATQRMTVTVDGVQRYSWRVSTGRSGYATPRGSFRPSRMVTMHYSKKWNNAPMPYSIFFTGRGHAIHGTTAIGRLGRPASHGCVRLDPKHAALLFALVRQYGMQNTTIRIEGAEAKTRRA